MGMLCSAGWSAYVLFIYSQVRWRDALLGLNATKTSKHMRNAWPRGASCDTAEALFNSAYCKPLDICISVNGNTVAIFAHISVGPNKSL